MDPVRPMHGVTSLTHWGVIEARGDDAASFLQGQLTQDVAGLAPGAATLAGYCSAKGRLLASFVVWRLAPDVFMLCCSADLLAPTLKRLAMFVLRARCKLIDASAAWRIEGLAGDAASQIPGMPQRIGQAAAADDGTHLQRLPEAAGTVRGLKLAPADSPATAGPALSLENWRWLEMQSGVPTIEAATVDQFVPQMINLELVGGVSFSKGCYPGQEVVARSQYRGTLKRRTALFDAAESIAPGDEVYDASDPQQPAGLVVNAAPHPLSGYSALVEIKLAALDGGAGLHLRQPHGPLLERRALPYALTPSAEAA